MKTLTAAVFGLSADSS